jgi:hypothetical protein
MGVPIALAPVSRRQIPLNQPALILPGQKGSGPRQVPVTLEYTYYEGYMASVQEGKAGEPRRCRLFCYELRPTAVDVAYEWAGWSSQPLGNPRLFANGPGHDYLAWAYSAAVFVADVSQPRCRCVAFAQDARGGMPAYDVVVPVDSVVPEARSWSGHSAFYADIRVQSVKKGSDGSWTVQVTGPKSRKVYTLTNEGGKWHTK